MKRNHQSRRRSERGIALLIAIFVLLLISVVAIALLVSSGTETALGANYRSSSTVYYAALAGLEEARGRLLPKNPNSLVPAYIPAGATVPVGQVVYLINRSLGEAVAPADSTNPYYDKEYYQEFGVQASSTTWTSTSSVWDSGSQPIPGPFYKWVRINAATEQSIRTDVDNDGTPDPGPPLFYDIAHLDMNGNPWPSLITTLPPATATQALEITALAALPNGAKKMLQYLVAPVSANLTFPAAVTMAGNNVQFGVPNSSSFKIDGTDQAVAGVCTPSGSPPAVTAVGYTNTSDASQSNIKSAIPSGNDGNYIGPGGTASNPSVNSIGAVLLSNLQNVGQLDSLVQTITQNADIVINGPATQSNLPSAMSATNPMTIVVNGDLTLNAWHATGYGLLLVTGTFTYDPDASWDGVVLLIGSGVLYTHQGGVGTINGALFMATTVDSLGNPLPNSAPLGSPYFHFTNGAGGYGVNYSSCAVQWAQAPMTYKILSFHDIPQ